MYRHRGQDGLEGEEVASGTDEPIGNYPRAFSHIGLVNVAWAIHQAEESSRAR